MPFTRYLALGDSISIDIYPALDLAGRDDAEHDSRELRPGLGAASLFARNDDALWPEFRGRDLAACSPGLSFRNHTGLVGPGAGATDNLATDGATTDDVLDRQLPRVAPGADGALVTLTVGGNDMLQWIDAATPPRRLVDDMCERTREILAQLHGLLPAATTLVATVYDPSDGTNELFGRRLDEPARWLARYNDAIRAMAADTPGVRLADIHRHFLGHGTTAPPSERWYWHALIVEPNARGASEVRRVWLGCIEEIEILKSER